MTSPSVRRGVLAAVFALMATAATAQEFRATVKGQVTDPSRAAVPGATVSVLNQETNENATTVTNSEGSYTLPFLRPGLYTLTVELSGFQKYVRKDMRLEVSQSALVNVQLSVGGVAEQMTVTAESPLLETGKADRGTVIDSHRISELPLQSRSPMALTVLVAGVNYNAQAIYLRPFDNGALADWSMNGGQNRNNEFLMDGAPNNANQGGNNIAYVPPADAVQEFKVQTNSFDAQYGRTAGGVVNMSLKSGTNSFHGSGYEYYRRKWLDANSFLLNSRGTAKVQHYLDQYGFEVDGPVVIPGLYEGKNKTFFMFNGEKYREGTPAAQFSSVPTAAMKNGDFSKLVDAQGRPIIIYDPATGRDVNGVWTRDPFPGNIVPANRFNATAKTILQYFPDPNCTTPGQPDWQQNLCYNEHFNKDLFWNWVGKVDHNFSNKDRTFFRWGKNTRHEVRNTTAIRTGPAQNGQLPLVRANDAFVGDWVHIFGGSMVFNVRGGYTYYLEGSQSDYAFGYDVTQWGWPASVVSQFPAAKVGGMFPVVTFDQFVQLSRNFGPNTNKNFSLQPNVTMTRGNHAIRSGLDIRRTNVYNDNYGNAGGLINFTRAFTRSTLNSNSNLEGNAFASFLLGAPADGNVPVNLFPHYYWNFVAPWIQDDWRLNDRLTLNLGFRWDFNGPVHEQENRLNYAFDPTIVNPISGSIGQQVLGGIQFLGVGGAPTAPWKFDWNNWQPRVGAAYQINDKTVLRAGYGRYFLNPTAQSFTNGFSQATALNASNDGGRTPTYNLSNPFPNGIDTPPGSSLGPLTFLGRNPSFSSPDFVVPLVHQFSIGVQRELPGKVALEASYVGSRSLQMQSSWGGYNEASAAFQLQCDVTKGGSRSFCDQLVPNPFFNVHGFEGTTRFTSATIARSELARPFPEFTGFTMTERNDGKLTYDSAQFVANKRWARGVTFNANYTWVPRWTEEGSNNGGSAFVDDVNQTKNVGPYFSQRKHRVTVSGVWELPWYRDQKSALGYLLGGWSIAPMYVFQSGQPWDMPGNVDIAPGVDLKDIALDGKKEGQYIYGVKPCVGTFNTTTGNYDLASYSVAYGCTQPYFLVRQAFQRRTAMFRYDEFRKPIYWEVDASFAKTTRITDKVRFQFRIEAFNLLNSPMYDELQYQQDTASADFGRIDRNTRGQSNFQRFIQLGFKLTW
jgi:Carboxypeptidase regulatory-like domain/TonB dependent receptor-like, beta-barrel/TonB-dependent Receptor Plug Domain